MSGGLDTRTAVDGFMRGMQAGNSMIDAQESRKDRAADREWTGKARERQAGEWAKKDDIEKVNNYVMSVANTGKLNSPEEYAEFSELQNKYPQYRSDYVLDPKAKQYTHSFNDLFNPETPSNLQSPETLEAASAVMAPWLNKGVKDGQKKIISMIAPGKTKGTVVIGVDVLDKEGKVISKNSPLTVGRRNSTDDPDGTDQVMEIPVKDIMRTFRGYEMMTSIQNDPKASENFRKVAIQQKLMNQPKGDFAVGRNDSDAFIYNKSNGQVVNTLKGRGKGGSGKQISDTDSVAVILGDWRDSQAKLVEGGMPTEEAASQINTLVYDQYGVTMESIQGSRKLLQAKGIAREPTVGEARKFMIQMQRAQQELNEQAQVVKGLEENGLAQSEVPPRKPAGLADNAQPTEKPNSVNMKNWGLASL